MGLFLISDIKGLCFGAEDVKAVYIGSEQVWPVGSLPEWIEFADPEVLRVLLANGVGADGGITEEQAAAVTSISTWFKGNTTIKSFDEFAKFTGVTSLNNSYNTNYGPFNGCTSLKSVAIPASVTYIGGGAFQGCTILEDVGDLSNVKTTHNGSFSDTPALAIDIYMPSLTKMLGSSFLRSGITKFSAPLLQTIPGGNLYNNGAFTSCVNLTEVDIPLITSVGKATFAECSSLERAELDSCTTIGDGAFQRCVTLSTIGLDWSKVTSLGTSAFYNCTSLAIEDLQLPNLTSLGQNAFYGVRIKKISNLGKITALPTASEGTQNFGDKSILEEAVISGEVTSIPNNSFNGYAALTSIKFPNKITLGEYAFRGCTALSDVDWTKITKVGYGAFLNCISLPSEITIPNMTQGIGQSAFSRCTSIIKFSASATSIGKSAFDNCKIEEVTLLNAVSLGSSAFNRNYQLKVVRLRDVTTFTGDVFFACSKLETVIVDNITPPSLSSNAFAAASSTFIIYVPDASVEAYKTASNWATYAAQIKPLSEYGGGS